MGSSSAYLAVATKWVGLVRNTSSSEISVFSMIAVFALLSLKE